MLVGQGQAAYHNISHLEALNYDQVKEEILYQLDVTLESYRQLFRAPQKKGG